MVNWLYLLCQHQKLWTEKNPMDFDRRLDCWHLVGKYSSSDPDHGLRPKQNIWPPISGYTCIERKCTLFTESHLLKELRKTLQYVNYTFRVALRKLFSFVSTWLKIGNSLFSIIPYSCFVISPIVDKQGETKNLVSEHKWDEVKINNLRFINNNETINA